MREGCKSSGVSEARAAARGSGGAGDFQPGSAGTGEGGESDRWGPVDRETRERWPAREAVIL
jgi:hypothetical protein